MKKPWSNKDEGMQEALKGLFPQQAKNISEGKCAFCGSTKLKETDFKDDLSRKEYTISGMCQACQDKVFKLPPEEEEDEEEYVRKHKLKCKDPDCHLCKYY